ncbi:MAG: glycosyl hydrolase [Armatimonadetes bacterium]|nr:glycosyl hydrolase [Armatimonadota bacterium]
MRFWYETVAIMVGRIDIKKVILCLAAVLFLAPNWVGDARAERGRAAAGVGNPYGFSVWGLTSKTVQQIKAAGVGWIRYQRDWQTIEPERGHFHWTELDKVVQIANQAGLKVSFPLQDAPNWAKTQVCDGKRLFAGPQQMAAYAGAVATRYDGKHGHGKIDAFEVGNEEYDNYWGGYWENSLPCRQPKYYGPVLAAAARAIRAANPAALVGFQGMWWLDLGHFRSFYEWIYNHGYGNDFDFANFHYYPCWQSPSSDHPNPSFDQVWRTIHDVMAAHDQADKPIWVTEFGWNINSTNQNPSCQVSPAKQSNYLRQVLERARRSGVMRRVFWYTIGMGHDGMSLTQDGKPVPAYYTLQSYARKYPGWSISSWIGNSFSGDAE